ncbi:MAG: lysophospholipid acyltransferase family protein [Acidimicrobiales bacterium]
MAFSCLGQLTKTLGHGWQLTVEGVENFPPTGPAIVAANHVSFLDSPLLMFELPRRVWFLGKAEYLESPVARRLFPALGMIPVARDGRRAALTAMRQGLAVLEVNECLGLYPEGTRSRDGRLYRGHTGLAWLAFKSGAPIVPIGIRGTDDVQPPGRRFPTLRGDCSIRIGEPVQTKRYDGRDRRNHRILTDEVMFEIAQLSGQTYADRYADLATGDGSSADA